MAGTHKKYYPVLKSLFCLKPLFYVDVTPLCGRRIHRKQYPILTSLLYMAVTPLGRNS
jgi:hypothetical protein